MTAIEQVRYLLTGDAESTAFSDAQIQLFLDLNSDYSGNDQIMLAWASGCDQLATKSAGSSASSLRLGDFSESTKDQSKSYQDQAAAIRDRVYNTPAFAIAEQNLSNFSALEIVRNYFLRNEI